jgi:hypothetical protein
MFIKIKYLWINFLLLSLIIITIMNILKNSIKFKMDLQITFFLFYTLILKNKDTKATRQKQQDYSP